MPVSSVMDTKKFSDESLLLQQERPAVTSESKDR